MNKLAVIGRLLTAPELGGGVLTADEALPLAVESPMFASTPHKPIPTPDAAQQTLIPTQHVDE